MKVIVLRSCIDGTTGKALRPSDVIEMDEERFLSAPKGYLKAVEEKPKKAKRIKKAKPSE